MDVIAILFAVGLCWHGFVIWLLRQYITQASTHWFCTWPAQLSVIAALGALTLTALGDDPFGVLIVIAVVLLPPLALLMLLVPFIAFVPLPLMLSAGGLCMVVPSARPYAPTISFLAAVILTPLAGDIYWDRAMCRAAQEAGLTDIQRPSFWRNLRRISEKTGREPYAYAVKDGEIWDWGYSAERFVRYGGDIPVRADLSGFEPLDCADRW